jgi:hypothetical protein
MGSGLQMLALALASITKEMQLSGVRGGALGWYVAATYVMMIVGKVITGFLPIDSAADSCGCLPASSPPCTCRS